MPNAIAANVTDITGVAPTSNSAMQVIAGSQNMFVQVLGITPSYLDINNIGIAEGDPLTQYDLDRKTKSALIGPTVSSTLFEGNDPVGQKIRMGTITYTIIGLLASKGETISSSDNMILIPLTTLQATAARSLTDHWRPPGQLHNRAGG